MSCSRARGRKRRSRRRLKCISRNMPASRCVLVRTRTEMAAVLEANPFTKTAPNRTMAIFLDAPPAADTIESATGRRDEEIALGVREIYVHYGDGMANSKLKIRAAETGTARNMNTIAKLVELANAL
jgi:uncharacterized protein (DUF1697 family)